MRNYALPRLARKRVDAVTTADVMAVLSPIWSSKRVTARRLRQRIGAVMKWAIAQGLRMDNPAGEAISAALPKSAAVQKHQRALPHTEVGAALRRVRRCDAYRSLRLAFEFLGPAGVADRGRGALGCRLLQSRARPAVSRTMASKRRKGGRSSAARRATNPER